MSEKAIAKELECSICQELLKAPTVIGSCLHTFCKECILRLMEAGDSTDRMICPVCRAECRLPIEGIDGLKKNFILSNLVDIFRTGEASHAERDNTGGIEYVPCTVCSITGRRLGATCVCDACMYITMCEVCRRKHGATPATAEHVVVELCDRDGKPESMFCKTCKCCACVVCVERDHGSHDVSELQPVFEESEKTLASVLEHAEKMTLGTLKSSKGAVNMVSQKIQDRQDSMRSAINARNDVIAVPDRLKHQELKKQKAILRKQLKAVEHDISVLDEKETDRHVKTIQLLGQLGSICEYKTNTMQDCVREFSLTENQICTAIRMGQRLKFGKVIGSNSHRSVTRTTDLLREMIVKVNKDSDVSSYLAEFYRMPAYSCAHSEEGLGGLTTAYAKRIFDFAFCATPTFEGDIVSVVATKEGIFAVLCKQENRQKVYIWTKDVPTVNRVIDKSVSQYIDQLVDMTCSPDGKIVLLRRRAPQLVIVTPSLGTIRTMKVRGLKDPASVAVSLDGFFIVVEDLWPNNLMAINENGDVVNTFPTERVQRRIISGRRAVYTSDWKTLYPYAWLGSRFIAKIPPCEHKIPDFNMVDFSLGNESGMFVIGVSSTSELKLYRLKLADGGDQEEPCSYTEYVLTDQNGVGQSRGIKAKCPISVDVSGYRMIVAYKDLDDRSRAVFYTLTTLD